jgi:hypothetical protein
MAWRNLKWGVECPLWVDIVEKLEKWMQSKFRAVTDNGNQLLRARSKRPRRRATDEHDELTPLHVRPPSSGDGILVAQTSTSIGAETGIKTIAAVHSQCRCWVNCCALIEALRRPLIAVGTRITARPPHRSVRAQFGHTAPTSGV